MIIAGWEFGSKRKLTWLALGLGFFWAGFQLYGEVQVPAKELIVYQGKKSQIFDFSDSGEVYSWNQGPEPEEISYSIDPNRIQNCWPHIPKSLDAFLKEIEKISFIATDFTFHPKDEKLHFFIHPKIYPILVRWAVDICAYFRLTACRFFSLPNTFLSLILQNLLLKLT